MTLYSYDAVTADNWTLLGFRPRAAICLTLLILANFPLSAFAQADRASPMNASRPTPVTEVSDQPAKQAERTDETVFGLLKSDDGTIVPLPPGTKYEDYLSWLSSRRGNGYGINSVELAGEVDGEEASPSLKLSATIKLIVHRDNEWVRVPLDFREALLDQVQHSGEGLASYEPFSKESGHAWSLQGRGEHELRLDLIVPITGRSDESRLALSTPANAATTRLKLRLPEGTTATATQGLIRDSKDQSMAAPNTLEWIGAGGKIDLSWRPQPTLSNPDDLSVVTTFVPTVVGKSLQLRARQSISPSEGQVSSVQVRLPEGFSLSGVEGALLKPNSERLLENGRVVFIELSEPAKSTFELTWRVTAPIPANGELTVSGFSVEGVPANAQSGEIYLEERSTAYQINLVDASSEGVSRVEMVEPAPTAVAAAYRFSSLPFLVQLKVEPVVPTFTVTPDMTFTVLSDRIDLTANFGVEVEKGELREMRLLWPVEDWSVTPIRAGRVQEVGRASNSAPPVELLVTNGSVPFEVPFRASRPRSDASQPISIPLPQITGASQQSVNATQSDVLICVRHPSNLRIEVTSPDGKPLEPFDRTSRKNFSPPDSGELLMAPADMGVVTFRIHRLSQEIRSHSVFSIRPRGEDLHLEQRIEYDIRNDPLSQVRLLIPESLLSHGLEIFDGSNSKLILDVTGVRDDGLAEVLVNLGASVIGQISVTARYDVKLNTASDEPTDVKLPKIQPLDGLFDHSEAEVWPMPRHSIRLISDDWTRNQSTRNDGQHHWIGGSTPSTEIPIQIIPKADEEISRTQIDKLLLRSVIDREGMVKTFIDCRLDSSPPSLAFRLPLEMTPSAFRWRGREVPAIVISENDQYRVLEVSLGDGNGEPVFAFETVSDEIGAIGFLESYDIPSIAFAEEVNVQETLWQVTLPESQHLFKGPSDFSSRFHWSYQGGIWTRTVDEGFRNIADWFGAALDPSKPEISRGHSYIFLKLDRPQSLKFISISRSLVVLLGAGMSILLGYAFVNGLIPQPRIALMTIAGVILLGWAFFASQVQIFLQPALFGLVLVAGAVFAERMLQRRQDVDSLPQSPSAVDLVTILPGDGSTSAPPAAIGSEEPTVLRTGRLSESVSSQSSVRNYGS